MLKTSRPQMIINVLQANPGEQFTAEIGGCDQR